MIWNLSFRWPMVSLKTVLHVSDLTPTSRAMDNPARMASYSAWLLDVLKAKWRDFLMRISLGPSSTMLAAAPFGFDEPSTQSVHWSFFGVRWRSLTKSRRHCALMGP